MCLKVCLSSVPPHYLKIFSIRLFLCSKYGFFSLLRFSLLLHLLYEAVQQIVHVGNCTFARPETGTPTAELNDRKKILPEFTPSCGWCLPRIRVPSSCTHTEILLRYTRTQLCPQRQSSQHHWATAHTHTQKCWMLETFQKFSLMPCTQRDEVRAHTAWSFFFISQGSAFGKNRGKLPYLDARTCDDRDSLGTHSTYTRTQAHIHTNWTL